MSFRISSEEVYYRAAKVIPKIIDEAIKVEIKVKARVKIQRMKKVPKKLYIS